MYQVRIQRANGSIELLVVGADSLAKAEALALLTYVGETVRVWDSECADGEVYFVRRTSK